MKPSDSKADAITFGVELETTIPVTSGVIVGAYESRLDRSVLRAKSPCLIGTALYGAVRRVVWDPWLI